MTAKFLLKKSFKYAGGNGRRMAMGEGSQEDPAGRLARLLQVAVKRALSGLPGAAVAFSGGLDSAVMALLVSRELEGTTLYTVGLPGARDLLASKDTAEALGLRSHHVRLELGENEVLEAAAAVLEQLPSCNPVELSFLLPSYHVFLHAREEAVVTGDGADELFGGYHRYLGMGAGPLEAALEADTRRLLESGIQRNQLLARRAGKRLLTPYLDDAVVRLAGAIPPEQKVGQGHRKLVLMKAAGLLGVPSDVRSMPKTAAQYGTAISRLLQRHPEIFER
jgi:asparagine synthase (glutamine-hydrolysing)